MLSYQHIYHAGNAADLHKHTLLAWMLDYLTAKPKPLSYLETHAGRGLYDLTAAEAKKTDEARAGILRAEAEDWLSPDHPLRRVLTQIRTRHGDGAYGGSPLIAANLLRRGDSIHLAELHPGEYQALQSALPRATLYPRDGFQMALAVAPPTPRRGLMLVDPSYEVKEDYARIPAFLQEVARKWNVGILALWYPILPDRRHAPMLARLEQAFPDALRAEARFPPARAGHGMVGSGMFVVNPPFGLAAEAERIAALFAGASTAG
ncbi:23S rRNA (adenine(2030)-N(6))-methyltransferase RlmJ [Paracoccus jeotgali]|uniref:Ribosomal RNA large subunit methyltransferase J n=1 Tax=Paracoccus jeotgali TaxID=2065379 RepID=A0A2K9MC48_9RHOB|nr:23S rRNA (adenine(2030)-N(6))-methyltransferase RlmJ [Paracoccus jeotgali]AUM73227.1 23S rRNA (adenine(2030)-N(6))-methyltransferase RlmJ [Paracoccus jeotgali]